MSDSQEDNRSVQVQGTGGVGEQQHVVQPVQGTVREDEFPGVAETVLTKALEAVAGRLEGLDANMRFLLQEREVARAGQQVAGSGGIGGRTAQYPSAFSFQDQNFDSMQGMNQFQPGYRAGAGAMSPLAAMYPGTGGGVGMPFADLSPEEREACCARESDFLEYVMRKTTSLPPARVVRFIEMRSSFYAVANMSDFNFARGVFDAQAGAQGLSQDLVARMRFMGWQGPPPAKTYGRGAPGAAPAGAGYGSRGYGSARGTGGQPRGTQSSVCFNCGEEGHWARECPRPHRSGNGRNFDLVKAEPEPSTGNGDE